MNEATKDSGLFAVGLDWRRWWALIPELIALTCAGILPVLVVANVISRYTDWYRILWAEDVIRVLFLWIVFLGGAVAVKYRAHVRMNMLSDRLMRWERLGVLWNRAIHLSPLLVGVILLVLGIRIVGISMHRELPMLQITVGYFTMIIPISGCLMIFYAARDFFVKEIH